MADAAGETLTALEDRLSRLDLLLSGRTGGNDPDATTDEDTRPVAARLDRIEKRMAAMCAQSESIAKLLQLRRFRMPVQSITGERCSKLADSRSSDLIDAGPTKGEDDVPAATKLPIVVASASVISTTSSQLDAIRESPMPPAVPLASLASLQSRLSHANATQEQQLEAIEWLRHRTSLVLEQWYAESILRDGDQWVDWEQRLARTEQAVRRREATTAREQTEI